MNLFQFSFTEDDHAQRSAWIDGISNGSSASKRDVGQEAEAVVSYSAPQM